MTDSAELIQAALDNFPDGVVLFDHDGQVAFWNPAAQGITGFTSIELLAQPIPESLEALHPTAHAHVDEMFEPDHLDPHRLLIALRHKRGHALPVVARMHVLRDSAGKRIGAAAFFHVADGLESLPHATMSGDPSLEDSRADLEERLQAAFDDLNRGGPPFGVLLVCVDQARDLLHSHGVGACHSMLAKVRHALAQGLRPTEEIGRWDEDEFLIFAPGREAECLARDAQRLAGQARTTDFRWWGDRLSITVSIGVARVIPSEDDSLAQLLRRARTAMDNAQQSGGNRAVFASEKISCSPS